jgi:hypothetical protein
MTNPMTTPTPSSGPVPSDYCTRDCDCVGDCKMEVAKVRQTREQENAALRAEVERLKAELSSRGDYVNEALLQRARTAERAAEDWARAYHYVTDILPLDGRNLVRDPACPMSLAEQDRHRVDLLIQSAETAERELAAAREATTRAVEAEREACAKLCDEMVDWPLTRIPSANPNGSSEYQLGIERGLITATNAIRARAAEGRG